MDNLETLKINFNGFERNIEKKRDFKDFLNEIKEKFNLSGEELLRINLTYKQDELIKTISTEEDYSKFIEELIYIDDSIIFMRIIPKIHSLSFRDDNSKKIYTKKYVKELEKFNDKLLNKINQYKNYIKTLKADIDFLEIENKNIPEMQPQKINDYKCKFLYDENEENIIKINIKEVDHEKPIQFFFKVENNGEEWPNDTYIKCVDNEELYFEEVGILDNDSKDIFDIKKEQLYHSFKVKIFFKDYSTIKLKEYILLAYLESKSEGIIKSENDNGKLIIRVHQDFPIKSSFNLLS